MIDLIGWTASAILLATLARQIITQSHSAQAKGVSHWLFIGQASASLLFVLYSVLLENWVFTVTNSCLLLTAIAGQWLTRRRAAPSSSAAHGHQTTS